MLNEYEDEKESLCCHFLSPVQNPLMLIKSLIQDDLILLNSDYRLQLLQKT